MLRTRLHRTLFLAAVACGLGACSDDGGDAGPTDVASGDVGGLDAPDSPTLGDADESDADAASEPDVSSDATPDAATEPVVVDEDSFECLTNWESVRGFYLTNLVGRTEEAVAAAEAGFAEAVPPGTIVQLVPFEAMVKLEAGASPETGDWEFFVLQGTGNGTAIVERGGAEVSNAAGSCLGCHAGAAERDFVCEDTGLCSAAALPRQIVDQLVADDPRCR